MPVTFLHFRSLNYTLQRAMDATIAHASVQIFDVYPEQPINFFCKK